MKTILIIIIILVMTAPAYAGRIKPYHHVTNAEKREMKEAKRSAERDQAVANRTNAQAEAIRQGTSDRKKQNSLNRVQQQMDMGQQQHRRSIRNGQQQRKAKAARSRQYTGF